MTKSPDPQEVLAQISRIEAEMRRIGLWQAAPLPPEQSQPTQAFGMDTMSFSQWLQFIFIPRVYEAAQSGQFPSGSQVAAQAVREFDGMEDASRLLELLSQFDRLF